MSSRMIFRPRFWVAAALTALGVTTAASFVRAQTGNAIPANTVTFGAGGGIPVRGTPLAQRGNGFAYGLPGPPWFGGWMRPAALMPNTPVLPKSLGQPSVTPQFNTLGTQGGTNNGAIGTSGSTAGGISGGVSGGVSGGIGGVGGGVGGVSGGISGGTSGGGGIASGAGLSIAGQNFQNPTGNIGFPQVPNPQSYIGGFAGGGITGTGITGNAGFSGVAGGGQIGGVSGSISGNNQTAGGIAGIGGFGGGGIGGKGAGFAGANGS
jgi:hypothetical protein